MAEAIGSPEIVTAAVRQGFTLPTLEVAGARLLAGGAMHDSWGADAVFPDHREELVVRLSPPARDDALKSRAEFAVMKAAYEKGVRCPRPMYVGENERGQTFMLMTRMPGETNPRQLVTSPDLAACRKAFVQQLAEDIATLHTISGAGMGDVLRGQDENAECLLVELGRQEIEYQRVRINPHPVIEWAFRWVGRNTEKLKPRTRPLHVVHGDLRTGNLMYDANGLTAILDWEGTHIGEAEEDLSWFLTKVWRFNRRDLAAGGVSDRETWVKAYERASGYAIDRDRLRLWEVFQNVRWAVICMMQAHQHLSGIMESHEHAAIGRRAADTELEILRLVGAA
jgi:aminoglycoside phosphotransferase (APT) family kinase protein